MTLHHQISLALHDVLTREGVRGQARFRSSGVAPSERQGLGAFVIPARLQPASVVAGATLETFVAPRERFDG